MKLIKNAWKHKTLFLMALPAGLLLIAFNDVPMAGLVVAFKKFHYADGIAQSIEEMAGQVDVGFMR